MFSRKEIFLVNNTLNVVPLVLQDQAVLIDLRNDTSVAGRVENADGSMNIHLSDAVFIDRCGLQYAFEEFVVRERMIRYIHLPANMDTEQDIQYWLKTGLRRKRPAAAQSGTGKRTYKQKRAEERHKEILQQIRQQKIEKLQAEADETSENKN